MDMTKISTCVIDEAIEPVRPSQDLVAELLHATQRANVGHKPFHLRELAALAPDERNRVANGSFPSAVNENGCALPGQAGCCVPALKPSSYAYTI